MTSKFLAGAILLALSAAAFAQGSNPDAVTTSVSQCPAALAAFAELNSLQEPAQTADKGLGAVNSCSYIERLRSEGDVYAQALNRCAAQGLPGLGGEIQRVHDLMSMLPDTPEVCQRVGGWRALIHDPA